MVLQCLRFGLAAHLACGLLPCVPVEFGEVRVAIHILLDLGDVQGVRQRQCLCVDLRTAHDEYLRIIFAGGDGLLQRVRDETAFYFQFSVARDDHRGAPRQRFADGIEGLAPHDHVIPHGQRFEMFQIFRAAPGQGVVHADGAVLRHGDDDGYFGHFSFP